MRPILRVLPLLGLMLAALAAAQPAATDRPRVVLQLRWDHQFQFAGFYAALWNGYYEAAGLEVELRPGFAPDGTMLSAVTEVAEGRAQFGIGAADILIARDRGTPLVVLASIFQQSAVEFYALAGAGLDSPADLTRLRVARRPGDLVDVELQALLAAEGIDPDTVPAHAFATRRNYLADLADRTVDVVPGYAIGTPYEARQRGLRLRRLRAISYGVDFYGDSLFTTAGFAQANPDLVAAFVEASLRGWRHALDHPDRIVARLAAEHEPAFPIADYPGFLRSQVGEVTRLALYPLVQPGHVNPHRWRRMHELLSEAGLVSGSLDTDAFVFDPDAAAGHRTRRFVTALTWGMAGLAGLLCLSLVWLRTLRRSVRTATAELHAAKDAAEQARASAEAANAAKSRFLAAASHDLRQPLQALVLFHHTLAAKNRDPEAAPVIASIGRSIEAQQQMLNALLDVSRLDAGIVAVNRQAVPLGPLLHRLADEFGMQAREHGLALRLVPTGAVADTDPALLERIVRNLLANAVRYTPSGRILLGCRRAGAAVRVVVRDTGPGIPPDKLGAVFEEFCQLDTPTRSRGQGLGLGLAIVDRLCRLLEHRISVISTVGRGTTFAVEVPRAEARAAEPGGGAVGRMDAVAEQAAQ